MSTASCRDIDATSASVQVLSTPLGLSTDGFGVAASLEGGYPVHLQNGWVVEPQAQLVYQHVDIDEAADAAATVRFSDAQSLAGHIGLRFARTWTLNEAERPRLATGWLRANLWHEFLGETTTSFSSADGFVPVHADLPESWLDLTAGLTAQLDTNISLYGSAG